MLIGVSIHSADYFRMLRRIFGPFVFLLGLGFCAFVFYKLFVVHDPHFDKMRIRAVITSVAFVAVGWKWMQVEQAR